MSLTQPLAERILGSRALAALTSPHGVDRYLEQINPMWAATEVRARVVDITRETSGENPVATITMQPTSTWRGHRAGQYVQVGVEINGARRTTRCFSISSAESNPGEQFSITVRAHQEEKPGQQRVSKFLVCEAQPGQILHLSQAQGEFTLNESPATPTNNELLMISGGSGITPVMSQIRTLLRDGYDGRANRKKVTFLHYARSPEDQIFAEELNRISWQDNGIDVHLRHGDEFFSAESLARLVPNYRDTDTWACGPAPMMDLVTEAYDGSPRLRTEFFKTPSISTGSAEGEMAFTRTGTSATNTGAPILDQAEEQGLTPEYGCRMGICFTCVSRKTEGTVRNVMTGEESSLPDEDIRICVSAPVGDCAGRALSDAAGHSRCGAEASELADPARRLQVATPRRNHRQPKGTSQWPPPTQHPRPTTNKKTDNKLTPEQIEAFGNEIDAIRQRLIGELGEEDANYIRGIVKKQRQFEVAGRALMYLPPAWPLAVAVAEHLQDPGQHGDRPQRDARPVRLDG